MKKNNIKLRKIFLLIISIFLFIGTITLNFSLGYGATSTFPSNATDLLNVPNISVNETDNNQEQADWLFGQSTISCSVTGKSGTCGGTSYVGEIQINYTGSSVVEVQLTYNLTLNGGSCQIDGNPLSETNDTFSKTINPNTDDTTSFIVFVKSSEEDKKTSLNITNFTILSDEIFNVTFLAPENGSYTVNGELVENDTNFSISGKDSVILSATPLENYIFVGWVLNGNLRSEKSEFTTSFSEDSTIYPYFEVNDTAVFKNNNKVFSDLNEAINSADSSSDKKIILIKNGTISGGTDSLIKQYHIKSGIQLLIPDDDSYLTYIGDSYPIYNGTGNNTPTVYRKLIVPNHTNIVVESGANIYVASKAPGAQGGKTHGANPTNQYGQIILSGDNSFITLNSNSTLYAYGYITGNGKVNALNGSLVREFFQVTDFKGGSKTLGMIFNPGKKVFIINKYYIQNIECSLIMNYGAVEEVVTGFVMSSSLHVAKAQLISTYESDFGLFKLDSGSVLEKKYDGKTDRLEFNLLQGNFLFSNISITLTMSINTKDYELPINNNMSINVTNGASVTISQDLCILPGAQINIDSGSTVNISSGTYIYLFNSDSYIGKNYSVTGRDVGACNYAVSRVYNRTTEDLVNASLNINGTLNISDGAGLYTTRSNDLNSAESISNVFSSKGTGIVNFLGTPTNKTSVEQYNYSSEVYESITVSQLALRNSLLPENENDTYLDLRSYDNLSDKSFYFSIEDNTWVDGQQVSKEYKITFVDDRFGLPNYTLSFTNGEKFTFPTAEEAGFIKDEFRIRKWKINGIGSGLFEPGEEYSFSASGDITAVAVWGGWVSSNGNFYYIDYGDGTYLTGINRVEHYDSNQDGTFLFKFDESGALDLSFTGVFKNNTDNSLYFIINGEVQQGTSLYSFQTNEQLGTKIYNYIYVTSTNCVVNNGKFYIETNSDDVLPSGYYNFDENGYIIREDDDTTMYYQDLYVKNDVTYIDGIRVAYGLFDQNNYLYYSDSNGNLVKNKTFYVADTKDYGSEKVKVGLYYFDSEGRMCDEKLNPIEVSNL